MGEKLSDKEVSDMLREADANGDGVIDYSGNYGNHIFLLRDVCVSIYISYDKYLNGP